MGQENSGAVLASDEPGLVERVRNALRQVVDPEAGINIVELGLVYRIVSLESVMAVDITMTSPTCPMGDMILDEAGAAVSAILPDGVQLELNLVWEPPWSPERMSETARSHFGW
ncbi:MAG: metal-sulfur cluster assembly factor [Zoogloeaceae bacterium]|nr:metal-sulfur cluster assembly factor [Zoogloeaceae bacterium]